MVMVLSKITNHLLCGYQKRLENEYVSAYNILGYQYEKGIGIDKDSRKAVYWFRKAAENNEPDGQYNLGRCYDKAVSVKQDYSEAIYWYEKSVTQVICMQ